MMGDGLLGKCKDCTRKDVRSHREKNIERIREYDRKRGNRCTAEYQRQYRKRFPKKTSARRKIAYRIRNGSLNPKPCEVCGTMEFIHAHHDDYDKPLEVRWLCAAHHHQWHAKHGEATNAT